MKTKISVKEFRKRNKWIRDDEHAKKLISEINENYRTGNYFTLEDLVNGKRS